MEITAPEVNNLHAVLSSYTAGDNTSIKVTFLTSQVGSLKTGDKIYITLPDSFSILNSITSTKALVNGIKTTLSLNKTTLAISVPTPITSNAVVTVEIPDSSGIKNPTKPGSYKISVSTDSDATPTDFVVEIISSSIGNVTFTAGRSGADMMSGYKITFTTGSAGNLISGEGQIFVVFNGAYAIPSDIPSNLVTINSVAANKVLVSGKTLVITVPKDISSNTEVTIEISEKAGIKNPSVKGSYRIEVYTSSEKEPVLSNSIAITSLPTVQFVVKPTSPNGDNGYYITLPTVQIISSRNANIYYKLDKGKFMEYSSPLQIQNGDHILYAYAIDKDGNKGYVVQKEFKVDTKQPQLTFDYGEGNVYTNNTHITLTGKMNEPCTLIRINGINADIDNKNLTFSASLDVTNGSFITVFVKSISGLTNSYVFTAYVDTVPPEITLISPSKDVFSTTDKNFTIKFRVNEKCRSVKVNNSPVQADKDGIYMFETDLKNGINVFDINAVDLAGNATNVSATIKKSNNIIIKLAIGSKTAYIGDKEISLDAPPIIKDNRTLVPLRFIAQAFGAQVQWDAGIKVVTILCQSHTIQLQIDSTIVTFDDSITKLDAPPIIKDNRTLVPLRFIAQAFGTQVKWDASTKTITLIYTLPTP